MLSVLMKGSLQVFIASDILQIKSSNLEGHLTQIIKKRPFICHVQCMASIYIEKITSVAPDNHVYSTQKACDAEEACRFCSSVPSSGCLVLCLCLSVLTLLLQSLWVPLETPRDEAAGRSPEEHGTSHTH